MQDADVLIRDRERRIAIALGNLDRFNDKELRKIENEWSWYATRYHKENRHDAGDIAWEVRNIYQAERMRRWEQGRSVLERKGTG